MSKSIVRLLVLAVLSGFTVSAAARAQSAEALMRETAKTMGGIATLRAMKNQVVESEGKQFDSSSTPQPLGPTRQISSFRYSLTRDLDPTPPAPRMGRPQFSAQSSDPFGSDRRQRRSFA